MKLNCLLDFYIIIHLDNRDPKVGTDNFVYV